MTRAMAAGAVAHAALTAAGGAARVLARPRGSLYLTAGAEIVWLGPLDAVAHQRALRAAAVPAAEVGDEIGIDVAGLVPWKPAPLTLERAHVSTLREELRRLTSDVCRLGPPAGFGALLAGIPLGFPLEGAEASARGLAAACARDDAAAACVAARGLLGLGAGLTPSGDDFVGGAFFARHLLVTAGAVDAGAWREAAAVIVAAARERTHAISAVLVGDLTAGHGHAPLHVLVAALAAGDGARAVQSAAQLVRLGHTSGWDLLAGLAAGLAG